MRASSVRHCEMQCSRNRECNSFTFCGDKCRPQTRVPPLTHHCRSCLEGSCVMHLLVSAPPSLPMPSSEALPLEGQGREHGR